MQKEEDLRGDDLKYYEAEYEAMNLILISIPNDIYNSVDAYTTTKAMWQRVERLMRGTMQNKVDRETRFNNKFDQFTAKPGEALVSVYNRFAQLMNDLERNGIIFPKVTINTKFLNFLQPEWLKYVTQKLVNASRAKKLEKTHDPLALVAHTGSSSRTTTPYYVTHPSSVVGYDDDYQGDAVQNNSEDPLTSAMILNDAGNMQRTLRTTSLGTASNVQCYNCSEKGVILTDEQNNFLFVDALRMKEIKELGANIYLMARIQPLNFDSNEGPSYDSVFLSEVMAAPTIPVFAEENLGDLIDIRVDIIHPKFVAAVSFPAAAVEEIIALRFRVDIAETKNASLCARIKTTEAIEKINRNRKRQARVNIEQ
nr:hypothetical protein [Tanacetum cinerariifolium]